MSPPVKCVIKEDDSLIYVNGVLHHNGEPLPSMKGCTFTGTPKIIVPTVDVAPNEVPVVYAPTQPTPVQPAPVHLTHVQPTPAQPLTGELQEVGEVLDLVKQVMNLPPWLAVALIAGVLFLRWQKSQKAEKPQGEPCKGHAALLPQVNSLSSEVQQLSARVGGLEQSLNKTMLKLLETPPPASERTPKEPPPHV